MKTYTDEQLVTNYLKGDEEALEVLIKRYLKPIYSFTFRFVGNSQDAEDITQEVFVKVWRNLKKFDKNKKFKTWIFSIAKNTTTDFFRKKKAIPFSEFKNKEGENVLIGTLADPAPLPNEVLEGAGIAQGLISAMEKLLPKYRIVLFLRYNDHFTFREVAEVLGESLNTVKSRHRRALIILRKLLSDS